MSARLVVLALGCALTSVAAYTAAPAQTGPPPVDPNSALQPDQNGLGCTATKASSVDSAWCRTQCSSTPPNCPSSLCECADSGSILTFENDDETPTFSNGDDEETEEESPESPEDAAVDADAAAAATIAAAAKVVADATEAATAKADAVAVSRNAANPNSALKPGVDPMSCKAKLKATVDNAWCQTQCGSNPPNCPKVACRCEGSEEDSEEDSEETPAQPPVAAAAIAPTAAATAPTAAADAATEAAAAATAAAAAATAAASESALAPQGDPMGCVAVKDAGQGIDDEWCQKTCRESTNCPKTMCECSDDNGVLRYDPNDPDMPIRRAGLRRAVAPAVSPEEDALAAAAAAQAANAAAVAAIDAANAASTAAVSDTESALAPQGDPMGCVAVKDAGEGVDDDYCRNTCSQSEICPKSMCECNDDNGVLRYDPNDPDIPIKEIEDRLRKNPSRNLRVDVTPEEEAAAAAAATQAAVDAAVAAIDAASAASADAAANTESALAPQGDPMGCVATKDAGEGIDDDWCRNTCSQSENCPASMCECSDDNGIMRYDPNDPDIPIKDEGLIRNRFRAKAATPAATQTKIDAPITAAEEAAANAADAIAVTAAAVAANEAAAAATEAAAATAASAANAAARADAADDGQSALAPQGDPMGCVATKDAGEGIDDDWCRNTCSESANCPKSMCECNDDNGIMRYDPNDPDIPIMKTRVRRPAARGVRLLATNLRAAGENGVATPLLR